MYVFLMTAKKARLTVNNTPEVYYNGKWSPICGHYFWDTTFGADLFCQQIGYPYGTVRRKTAAGHALPLESDGIRIGKCTEFDTWPNCSGACNDLVIGGIYPEKCHGGSCRAGDLAGVKIECSGEIFMQLLSGPSERMFLGSPGNTQYF